MGEWIWNNVCESRKRVGGGMFLTREKGGEYRMSPNPNVGSFHTIYRMHTGIRTKEDTGDTGCGKRRVVGDSRKHVEGGCMHRVRGQDQGGVWGESI